MISDILTIFNSMPSVAKVSTVVFIGLFIYSYMSNKNGKGGGGGGTPKS